MADAAKAGDEQGATPSIDSRLAQNIDDWLERISSFSMIGKPVRPILVSGWRADICAIKSRSASVAWVRGRTRPSLWQAAG